MTDSQGMYAGLPRSMFPLKGIILVSLVLVGTKVIIILKNAPPWVRFPKQTVNSLLSLNLKVPCVAVVPTFPRNVTEFPFLKKDHWNIKKKHFKIFHELEQKWNVHLIFSYRVLHSIFGHACMSCKECVERLYHVGLLQEDMIEQAKT